MLLKVLDQFLYRRTRKLGLESFWRFPLLCEKEQEGARRHPPGTNGFSLERLEDTVADLKTSSGLACGCSWECGRIKARSGSSERALG